MPNKNRLLILSLLSIASFGLFESPASANAPIFWGLIGAGPLLPFAAETMGIAFAVVVLIEAFVFTRFFKVGFWRALFASFILNVVSSLIGFLIGGFSSAFPDYLVIYFLFITLLIGSFLLKYGMPNYYFIQAIVTVIIGSIWVSLGAGLTPSEPRFLIILALSMPLLIGFGLTILIEASAGIRFFKRPGLWKGILTANIVSYIFLILWLPFSHMSPYANSIRFAQYRLKEMISRGSAADEIIGILHGYRMNNLELLGLAKERTSGRHYDPYLETRLLEYIYIKYPEISREIIDDTKARTDSNSDERKKLDWFDTTVNYWLQAKKAIDENDTESLNRVSDEWTKWDEENKIEFYSKYAYVNPGDAIKEALEEKETNSDNNESTP